MSTENRPEPEFYTIIRKQLEAGDPQYRILYKYQSFRSYTCDSLRTNSVKFSRHAELNDAFDLAVRFPARDQFGPTYGDIWRFLEKVKPLAGQGYNIPREPDEFRKYISNRKWRPLEPLALLAAQLNLQDLIEDLALIKAEEHWCGRVLADAMWLVREWTENSQVFCLTNNPQSHLMWGYYGDGLRGLCIGYGCPIFANPRFLDPVRYESRIKPFDPVEAAFDPEKVMVDMLYTKPTAWKHEAEWRGRKISFNSDSNGVMGSFFPIMRVIIGYRMPEKQRAEILEAIDLSKVGVWEAAPDTPRNFYKIGWRPLKGYEDYAR